MFHDEWTKLLLRLFREVSERVANIGVLSVSSLLGDDMRKEDRVLAAMLIERGICVPERVTLVVPPATRVLLDDRTVALSIASIEELRIREAVWNVRATELWYFLELSKVATEVDVSQIIESSVAVYGDTKAITLLAFFNCEDS